MAKIRIKVEMGCRDCAMCTGRALTGMGRSLGRGVADWSTLGVSNLARRKCKQCSHPMSEHQVSNPGQMYGAPEPRQMYGAPDTTVQASVPLGLQAVPVIAAKPNPDRWVPQADGSFRWWAGDHWTAHFSADPTSPDPTLMQSIVEPIQAALPAEVSGPDHFAQIRQLAELRDAGILTEEEFATKKAEILARM